MATGAPNRADIILPGAAYTEENGLFVNTEGRPQLALRAGFAPGEAKENWAILRALSAELGATLPWDSLARSAGRRWSRRIRIWAGSTRCRRTTGPRLPVKGPGKASFRNAIKRLLPDQPDRPRVDRHGRTVGHGQGAGGGPDGGGIGRCCRVTLLAIAWHRDGGAGGLHPGCEVTEGRGRAGL